MGQRIPPERYPWWVRFTLIGARTRERQWLFFWLSLLLAPISVYYALFLARTPGSLTAGLIGGIGLLIAALMYWLTIRWMDRHGTWR